MIHTAARLPLRRVPQRLVRVGLASSLVGLLTACAPAAKRPTVELVPPLSETAFDEFVSSVAERIVAAARAANGAPPAIAPPRVSAGGVEPLWIASNFATALTAALNDRLAGAAIIGRAPTTRPTFRSAVQFARSKRDLQARAVAFTLWDADERLVFRETRGYASGVLPDDADAGALDAAGRSGAPRGAASARQPMRGTSASAGLGPVPAAVSQPRTVVGEKRADDRPGDDSARPAGPPVDPWFGLDMEALRAELLARAEALQSRARGGVDGAVVFIDACADEQVELISQYWSTSPDGRPRVELALRAKRAAVTGLLRVLFLDEAGAAIGVTPVVPTALVPDCEVTIALAADDPHAAQYVVLVACSNRAGMAGIRAVPGGW